MDYALFCHGFLAICTGTIALLVSRPAQGNLARIALAVFFLTHGVCCWLSLITTSYSLGSGLDPLALSFDVIALLSLLFCLAIGSINSSQKYSLSFITIAVSCILLAIYITTSSFAHVSTVVLAVISPLALYISIIGYKQLFRSDKKPKAALLIRLGFFLFSLLAPLSITKEPILPLDQNFFGIFTYSEWLNSLAFGLIFSGFQLLHISQIVSDFKKAAARLCILLDFSIVTLLIFGAIAVNKAAEHGRVLDAHNHDDVADIVLAQLRVSLSTAFHLSATAAHSAKSFPLEQLNSDDQNNLNKTLKMLSYIIPDSACFVVDRNGIVIASSNYDTPGSFVSIDVSSRRYFAKALNGTSDEQVVQGLRSNQVGYYASTPIYNNNSTVIGVAVVKVILDYALSSSANQAQLFLTDQHGIVISSVPSGYRLSPLWASLSDSTLRELQQTTYHGLTSTPVFNINPQDKTSYFKPNGQLVTTESVGPGNLTLTIVTLPKWQQGYRSFALITTTLLTTSFFFFYLLYFKTRENRALLAHSATTVKDAASKFEQSELTYRTLVESSPDVIYSLNTDGVFTYISNGARQLGYTPEEIVGHRLLEYVHDDDKKRIAEIALQSLEKGVAASPPAIHFRIRAKDGSYHVCEEIGSVIKDANNKPIQIIGITRDITDKENIRQQLLFEKEKVEAASKELELAAKRAQELALSADQANRAKSDFLANVSHEIRTPLSGILGVTELMQDSHLTPQQKEYVDIIKQSSSTLYSIINSLLDISKIEAGKMDINETPFCLQELLYNLLRPLQLQAEKKGLSFSINIADNLPTDVIGDKGKICQVLTNLIGNAIKFTETGSVTVRALPLRQEDQRLTLYISIKDTGIGVSETSFPELFKPFFQVDSSLHRRYGGTGLGLYISKQLADALGGGISVKSKENEGSLFSFTLPLKLSLEEDKSVKAFSNFNADTYVALLKGKRPNILVCEDNPINITVISRMLERCNLPHMVAKNGNEALDFLRNTKFELVLMDVQMPELDGLEATKNIRAGYAGKQNIHIPVIALTAHALSADKNTCFSAGMNDYLAKPVSFQLLIKTLATYTLN